MASRPVRLKLLPRTTMKAKTLSRMPVRILGGDGITVERSAGTWTVSLEPGFLTDLETPTVLIASGSVTPSDVVVQTNQSGAIALTVLDSVAWALQNSRYGLPLTIMDISGSASTNNVTINFAGGQTASGLSSLVISSDYGVLRLAPKSGGGWVAL